MSHIQTIIDLTDRIDATQFGSLGKLFDQIADAALRANSEHAALVKAARGALNYITNTENELGITLSSGDDLREILAEIVVE